MAKDDVTLDSFGIAGDWQADLEWSDTCREHYVRQAVSLLAKRGGDPDAPKLHFALARWLYEAEEHGRGAGVHSVIEALRSSEEWLARTRRAVEGELKKLEGKS